ncbi:MAG: hypothetical protein WC815_19845 [Vicinamibacterales bacterium]|jgi:hypothetical protein
MSEFTIRSESVDVEQIMKQIRQRILEKRGADYTEEQIRELASVRLEKFLEPRNLRSDLLEQFRKSRPAVNTEPAPITPPYTADEADIFATHRGILRLMRKIFNPLLKLMFNPNPLLHVIHKQAEFNVMLLKRESRRKIEFDRSRAEWNALYYEVLHNLVLETTRMGIEAQNLRMRVESLSSRLDFSERRVRALEGVVQYRPEVINAPIRRERDRDDDEPAAAPATGGSLEGFVPTGTGPQGQGPQPGQGDGSRKRRRRRRGRRGGAEGVAAGAAGASGASSAAGAAGDDAGGADDDADEGPEDFDAQDTQETVEAAPDASASARENSGELRRDLDDLSAEASAKAEAASGREVGPDAPASSDDNGKQ